MQKLDYIIALDKIVKALHSHLFIDLVENFGAPIQKEFKDARNFLPYLLQSKSGYDILVSQRDEASKILASVNAGKFFDNENFASIVMNLSTDFTYFDGGFGYKFYGLHISLVKMLRSAKELLADKELTKPSEELLENGLLVFEVVNKENQLSPADYSIIFQNLSELFQEVSNLLGLDDQQVKVVLLDSGSNVNTAIKSSAEVAKLIFDTFREVWEYIVHYHYKRAERKDEVLLKSLTMRAEIQKRVKDGVITKEEGKEYEHYIRTRTNKLLKLNTIPKTIVMESEKTSTTNNRDILAQINEQWLLEEGDSTGTDG